HAIPLLEGSREIVITGASVLEDSYLPITGKISASVIGVRAAIIFPSYWEVMADTVGFLRGSHVFVVGVTVVVVVTTGCCVAGVVVGVSWARSVSVDRASKPTPIIAMVFFISKFFCD